MWHKLLPPIHNILLRCFTIFHAGLVENANLDSNASIGILLLCLRYASNVSAPIMDFYLFHFSKYRELIRQLNIIQAHYQIQMGLHESWACHFWVKVDILCIFETKVIDELWWFSFICKTWIYNYMWEFITGALTSYVNVWNICLIGHDVFCFLGFRVQTTGPPFKTLFTLSVH